ncbi:MAG TPA: ATP-dependent endonuclease [Holosporales bacterium]|nr:ATP-dependent endonuclease [Holosporales bacterium]
MDISKITVKNFRLLRDTTLDVRKGISLLIGKNNTGKTSIIALFEKFFKRKSFDFNDFPLCQRNIILTLTKDTLDSDLAIQMIIEIKYDMDDNLGDLSEFILDLDETVDTVKILFECAVDKVKLLKDIADKPDQPRYISKNLGDYMNTKLYVFQNDEDLNWQDRSNLVVKDLSLIQSVINLQVIHAKRDVSSSEDSSRGKEALSLLTTNFFKHKNKNAEDEFADINQQMIELDGQLNGTYATMFDPFLQNAKLFLNMDNLKVVSNIQSNELVSSSSQVVYGDDDHFLPEHLNGLGFMNILYLLLNIEIKKDNILKDNKLINILFIEEPEAHTHPQMQYVFAKQINKIIQGIDNLQTIITTHSSHVVSQCNFKDVRYLAKTDDSNIIIKNFHDQLEKEYEEFNHFKFLVQYLTLQSSELFFADKIIFIEGTTENILLPYFMDQFDKTDLLGDAIPLGSQHISILEVGANAKVFAPFLKFLGIKTLIITDIDSVKKTTAKNEKGTEVTTYPERPVCDSDHTSNCTIKHFYLAPEVGHKDYAEWYGKLRANDLPDHSETIKVAYQLEEDGYHARSFEDAFIHINREKIKTDAPDLEGLKNKHHLKDDAKKTYELTTEILGSKSAFASSLLYHALTVDGLEWSMPLYIKEALSWLVK